MRSAVELVIRRSATVLVLCAACLASACGAVQRAAPPAAEVAWSSDIFAAVPAEAGGAWVSRFQTDQDATGERTIAEGVIHDTFARWFGFPVDRDQDLRQYGFAPDGDLALFARGTSLTLLVALDDSERFDDVVAEILAEHESLQWREIRPAGVPVMSVEPTQDMRLDIGRHGNFGFARVSLSGSAVQQSSLHLAELFHGYPSQELVHETVEYRTMLERLSGSTLTSIGYVRTMWASELLEGLSKTMEARRGAFAERPDFEDVDEEDACRATSRAMSETLPWVAVATSGDDSSGRSSLLHVSLREDAAAHVASLTPHRVNALGALDEHSAVSAYGGLSLRSIWESLPDDPTLAACPDIAMFPGFAALARMQFSDSVERNLQLMDGRMAFGLADLHFEGIFPMGQAVLMLGSPRPVRLLQALQRALEGVGAQGQVLESTVHTTLEYRLFAVLRVRLFQTDDRVVLSLGQISPSVTHWLASEFEEEQGSPLVMRWRGEKMGPILRNAYEYLDDGELLHTQWAPAAYAMLQVLERVEEATLAASLLHDGIELRLERSYESEDVE